MVTQSERQLWLYVSLALYWATIVIGVLFSFSFTDPNLVLSSNPWYWQWQQWLWHTWFDRPPVQAQTFTLILTAQWLTFLVFGWLLWRNKRRALNWQWAALVLGGLMTTACISYNALSHDVFNYMFNAKMVLVYQADPHVKTALDFVGDPWLRFMHNTHTPAPYGYGWTALSLVPSAMGGGIFIITWLLFRLMAVVSLVATGCVLWRWLAQTGQKHRQWLIVLLGCSPYILSEVVMNAHNDLWMLLPAVGSIFLLDTWRLRGGGWKVFLAVLLLGLSIAIKFATIVLVPLAVLVLFSSQLQRSRTLSKHGTTANIALLASVLLCLPLLTERSQFFHSWYLTWPLVWLPLIKRDWWWAVLVGFAVSSTYRYVPWIAAGGFAGTVLQQQQLVTWIGGALVAICIWIVLHFRARSV